MSTVPRRRAPLPVALLAALGRFAVLAAKATLDVHREGDPIHLGHRVLVPGRGLEAAGA